MIILSFKSRQKAGAHKAVPDAKSENLLSEVCILNTIS